MRKSILLLLVTMIAVVAVACGNGNNAGNDKGGNCSSSSSNGGNGGCTSGDPWDLYVASYKKGRSWTHSMASDMKMTVEVTDVTDDEATTLTTMYGADGKVMGDPTEAKVNLKKAEPTGCGCGCAPKDPEEKEIEVKAGKFECVSYDGKTWMMKKYSAIMVKSDTMELVEFKE